MSNFPNSQQMSCEWLNRQLVANGIDGQVVDFDAEPIGTGQIGKCLRYTLTYAAGTTGPATLIGKFPSDDEISRVTGVMLKNFLKEVRFYQQLQSRLTIRTPHCYFTEIDGDGPDFVLLMEDLAPAVQGDQLAGCDAQVARAAVLELVGLHGPSWCDESLFEYDWVRDSNRANDDATRTMYRDQLPGFLQRYGDKLASDEARIIEQVGRSVDAPLFAPLPDVFSLVHVDYRLDNLMINQRDGGCDVTTVDWQSITLGAPLNDVAYFMGAGMVPELRREAEEDIVRAYHQRLVESGVKGFSWADCWHAYRRGTFAGFGVTVIASMLVQRTTRGDEMFTVMARRHARHALDLGAEEFLT